ncbi:DUF4310 family protein [Anaeropeptidivorans aminofermentans]|jgi:uncharacterized protein (TIGR03579 family)|uniref:DUF4310 family protein n=1 Tax=Anaeropeptidivorans aminofermentans TaxID=2934315 RepID=UPI00202460CE|nr:DUF4310 family protein [Anaeropeptidivorans aminofermentans]
MNSTTENKRSSIESFMLTEKAFLIFMAMICAGVFAGTSIFIQYNTGHFSTTSVTVMLSEALKTGSYAALIGYTGGFLLARILEGPLVGILDIGGSIMTGVGAGLPALFLSMGYENLVKNFPLSLLTGAAIGLAIGAIILLIRKLMPGGYGSMGTDIMVGAGNIVGEWFGPIILIMAAQFDFYVGVGAMIGAIIFHVRKSPIIGGAILGAMIVGYIAFLMGLTTLGIGA